MKNLCIAQKNEDGSLTEFVTPTDAHIFSLKFESQPSDFKVIFGTETINICDVKFDTNKSLADSNRDGLNISIGLSDEPKPEQITQKFAELTNTQVWTGVEACEDTVIVTDTYTPNQPFSFSGGQNVIYSVKQI